MNNNQTIENMHRLISDRYEKLKKHKKTENAYPNNFFPSHSTQDLHKKFNNFTREELLINKIFIKISGRIMLKRIMGKASFINIQDELGRIQIYIEKNTLGESEYDKFKQLDIGDIVYITGYVFKTHKSELSIKAESIILLTKSLRPLPDKFHGISDKELRYRQRYVDLIMNEQVKNIFFTRSKTISLIRQIMTREKFLEVETPMLHIIPGGANAKPFITHHNALNTDMFLRIAPELYLKKLIVGGFERVFELNRNFRNEGISTRHNPEFTMMEFYAAYTDYNWMMTFTENLIKELLVTILGSLKIEYQGTLLDFSKPFDKLTICEAIIKYSNKYDFNKVNDIFFLKNEIKKLDDKYKLISLEEMDIYSLQLILFEHEIEEKIYFPTYIIDYPVEISPLAKASQNKPNIAERFELFIAGRELANGFSELNDPEEQSLRFKQQIASKSLADDEKMFYDDSYIKALEYGMPPTGGCGIGIDRLIMLMTNSTNIRDVIFFPHLRPEV